MGAQSEKEFDSYSPDELSELFRKNPGRFRELADEAIDRACIGHNPKQTIKLQQMQWRIDGLLRKGKTPLQRLRIMEEIFYTEVFGEEGQLAQLMFNYAQLLHTIKGKETRAKRASLRLVK